MDKNPMHDLDTYFYQDEPQADPLKVIETEVDALNNFNNRQILAAVEKLREVQPQTTGAQVRINQAIRELTMIAEGMLDV